MRQLYIYIYTQTNTHNMYIFVVIIIIIVYHHHFTFQISHFCILIHSALDSYCFQPPLYRTKCLIFFNFVFIYLSFARTYVCVCASASAFSSKISQKRGNLACLRFTFVGTKRKIDCKQIGPKYEFCVCVSCERNM